VYHFCESVHTHVYRIISLGWWQLYYEIHRHRFRGAIWNREGVELAVVAVARCLISRAGVTCPNVLVDKLPHPWPGVVPRDQFQRLVLSQVARRLPVVMGFQDPEFDLRVCRHINSSLFEPQAIDSHHGLPVHGNVPFLCLPDRPFQVPLWQLLRRSNFLLLRIQGCRVHLSWMKEGRPLSDFVLCYVVWSPGQRVRLAPLDSGAKVDYEVIFR